MRGLAQGLEWVYGKITGKDKQWAADERAYQEARRREIVQGVEQKLALSREEAQRLGEAALAAARSTYMYGEGAMIDYSRAAAYFALARLVGKPSADITGDAMTARLRGTEALVLAEEYPYGYSAISNYTRAAAQLGRAGVLEEFGSEANVTPEVEQ